MIDRDKRCSILLHFRFLDENHEALEMLCKHLAEKTKEESKCLHYEFSFSEDRGYCQEAFADAEAVLEHFGNIASVFEEALKVAEIIHLDILGQDNEIAKLREPLAHFQPRFFTVEYGFRR